MSDTFQYDSSLVYDTHTAYDPYAPAHSRTTVAALAHLAAPLQLGDDGSFSVVYQDTITEVAQNVEVICGSVQGERTVVPDFGLPMTNFEVPNKNTILNAINAWEKRALATVRVTASSTGVADVDVRVSIARG